MIKSERLFERNAAAIAIVVVVVLFLSFARARVRKNCEEKKRGGVWIFENLGDFSKLGVGVFSLSL